MTDNNAPIAYFTTDRVTKRTLEGQLKRLCMITGRELALESWSDGSRRRYTLVEIDKTNGGQSTITMTVTSKEMWLMLDSMIAAINYLSK